MNKKAISGLLALSMICTLFVACNTSGSQPSSMAPTESGVSQSASKSASAASTEGVKLKALAVTHSWTKDLQEIPMFTDTAAKLGITLEWEQLRSGWDEKKNTLLASGDVPDLFVGNAITDNDIASFGGLFLPLNDLIATNAPNIQKMFDETPAIKSLAQTADGNIYGLPSVIPHRPSSFTTFSINKVWLEKLGLKMPTTFDEFYTVLKAFKTQDPNGNGQQDEIPFDWAPERGLFTAMSLIGAYGNYAEDFSGDWLSLKDGKVIFLPDTEDYKQLIIYLNKLYSEGLINQEVFTQDYSQFQNKSKDPNFEMVGATMGWSIEDRFGPTYAPDYDILLPLAAQSGIKPIWL